jgi:hypothetical protein
MAYPPDPAVNMGQPQYTGVQFAAAPAPTYSHPPPR